MVAASHGDRERLRGVHESDPEGRQSSFDDMQPWREAASTGFGMKDGEVESDNLDLNTSELSLPFLGDAGPKGE